MIEQVVLMNIEPIALVQGEANHGMEDVLGVCG